MTTEKKGSTGAAAAMMMMMAIVLTSFSAWVTHVVTCFQSEQWLLLIAGAVAAPLGIAHGIYIWFV